MTEPDEAPGKTVLPGTVFAGGTTPDTAPPPAAGAGHEWPHLDPARAKEMVGEVLALTLLGPNFRGVAELLSPRAGHVPFLPVEEESIDPDRASVLAVALARVSIDPAPLRLLIVPVLRFGVVERWVARQRGNGIDPASRLTYLMAEDLGDAV